MGFISIDPTGQLTVHVVPVDAYQIRRVVGQPGWGQIRLRPGLGLRGFCNDEFQSLNLPRNPVGALVLAQLGASRAVYAGPVVITGWDTTHPLTEIADLSEVDEGIVHGLHTIALEGGPASLHGYADYVLSAPFQGMRSLSLEELPGAGEEGA